MVTEKRYRAPVQLGVTPKVFKRLRQRAREEGLSLAAWIRLLAIRELRRKKAPI
jgi:hypothetical protein